MCDAYLNAKKEKYDRERLVAAVGRDNRWIAFCLKHYILFLFPPPSI